MYFIMTFIFRFCFRHETKNPVLITHPIVVGTQPPQLPERPGPGHPLYHYVVSGPHGIALFDYNGDTPSDLSFKVIFPFV